MLKYHLYQNFTLLGGGIAATFCGAIESRCSFIIKDSFSTGSCTEWYVRCKELNLAWMDSAPCSPRRPNPTYVLFAHGMHCMFFQRVHFYCYRAVWEGTPKVLHELGRYIVSIGLCTVISYMYLYMADVETGCAEPFIINVVMAYV